jgi:hypothetical protein
MLLPLPPYPTYEELHELLADPRIGGENVAREIMALVRQPNGLARLYEITAEWRASKTKAAA